MKLQITETITHEEDIDIDKLKKLFEVKGWKLEININPKQTEMKKEEKAEENILRKEAERYCGINKDNIRLVHEHTEFSKGQYYGFWHGHRYTKHLNRWRKVEEELPEIQKETYQVIVLKLGSCLANTFLIHKEYTKEALELILKIDYVTEWKPIN